MNTLEDPWPDDQPLNLHITVKAENPLASVRLLIKSGQQVSRELVANVMTDAKHELDTDYRLILESYVDSDLAQVEIVAEATDRAVPTPLVGQSEPLRLNTASAYGRYRQALDTLRQLKQEVDQSVAKQAATLPPKAHQLAAKAMAQSERSPFFDGLDRVTIHGFEARTRELTGQRNANKIMELAQTLDDFLFEHEILDDRERDRDFFVAARSLSRLIEEDQARRPVPLELVTARMKKFLDDRHERWEKRVARLPAEFKPESWPIIETKKPFHAAMDKITKLDKEAAAKPAARSEQLAALSKTTQDYRTWIEELEAQEDRMRAQQDRQRQEGLASARNTLRELQKRQGEISAELDRADVRDKHELEKQWPTPRLQQNTNARETHRLEAQMRMLSPSAAERVQAAAEAMDDTLQYGNSGKFPLAESSADLAGRLLRQADSAARREQQKRRGRGRRRQVAGDNYYGQSVIGGDVEIKREYHVDRRYREDILDEVQPSAYDDDNRSLLEDYLRHVVR